MEVEADQRASTGPASEDPFPVPCTLSSIGAAASGAGLGAVFGFGELGFIFALESGRVVADTGS